MEPVQKLVNEHRLIEQVLNCLERMAEESARRNELDAASAADAIVFFRTFVHDWHFPREEAFLTHVPDPAGGAPPINSPFRDHQRCRQHLAGMEQAAEASLAGDPEAATRFAEHANAYITVLMKHHEDEEDRVFPMIERALTERGNAQPAALLRSSPPLRVDQRQLDACIHIANHLADHLNMPRSGGTSVAASNRRFAGSSDP